MAYQDNTLVINSTATGAPVPQAATGPMVLLGGSAPQGPDVPTLVTDAGYAALFGSPTANDPYTLYRGLYLMDQQGAQGTTTSPLNYLVCRMGVVRATTTVGQLVFTAAGPYAGSKGNNTAIQISVAGGYVTSVTLVDTTTVGGPTALYTITSSQANLTTYAGIITAITLQQDPENPATVLGVTTTGSATYPPTATTGTGQALTGGADGLNVTAADATVAGQLAATMGYDVEWVWLPFDAATVASTVATHLTAAHSEYSFRTAVLGPAQGTAYTALGNTSTLYGATFANDRIAVAGHDAIAMPSPVTGTINTYDGYYAAATFLGLKASGQASNTQNNTPLKGVLSYLNTGVTGKLKVAQAQNLSAGRLVAAAKQSDGTLGIRNYLTTAPFNATNGIDVNPFAFMSVRHTDNKVQRSLSRAFANPNSLVRQTTSATQASFQGAAEAAMASNSADLNGYTVSVDKGSTAGNMIVNVAYGAPSPVGTLTINLGLSLNG